MQLKLTTNLFNETIFLVNSAFLQQLKFSRQLNLLFLSVLLFAMAMGINLVTFPTVLNKHGVSSSQIGLAFTLDSFGGILVSFFLSRIVSKLSMMRTLCISSFAYAAIILLIYFYQNFYWWAALAFVMGSLWFTYVITRQSWLNILVEDNQRGIAMGIFSMSISAGIACGPFVVKLFGADNYFTFVASAALVVASFFCLKPLKSSAQPNIQGRRIKLYDFFKTNPVVFLGRFFLEFQTYFLLTFSVLFGVKIGLSYEAAGLLISAYMASGFFDVIAGFALKKWSALQLINFGFIGCLCCFLAVIFIHNYHFLLSTYFVFGIFVACAYVSLLKASNDSYEKHKLVAVNATFQLVGSGGSFFGSLVGGILFNIFGAQGFPITMVLSCICYLSFLVFNLSSKSTNLSGFFTKLTSKK